jgi:hypothetical protein
MIGKFSSYEMSNKTLANAVIVLPLLNNVFGIVMLFWKKIEGEHRVFNSAYASF